MFNGTGANVVSLHSMLPRWGAVICTSTAHIHCDENGAPERIGGLKLLTVPTPDGKLTPELIDREAWGWGDEHRAQPLAVSITQTTELGTAYTAGEIRAIADHVHARGMKLHVDGARISNAAAALDAAAAGLHHGRRRRHPQLRRHEERAAARRGGRRPEPGCGIRAALPAQAHDAAGVQDAVRVGAADRPATRATCGCARRRTPTRWPRTCAGAWRRAWRTARSSASDSASRRSPTPCSPSCRPASPTGCASTSGSTTGTPPSGEVRWMCAFDTTESDIDRFVDALKVELAA